jgi:2-dehydro-3-deoxy-L-rhamnonate dehydrogenase (NAD+)
MRFEDAAGRTFMNQLDLQGRHAVVTGGASGLGLAIAERLKSSGASVTIWDIDEATGRAAAAALSGNSVVADVSDLASVTAALHATLKVAPGIDILINNAGISGPNEKLWEYPVDGWHRVFGINVHGVFNCCRTVVPLMRARNYGRIVNIASVAGLVGSGGGAAYTASKHGVVGLTRQLAITYAGRGITVNAICPGAIQTGLRDNSTRILGADAPPMRGVGGDEAAVRAITPAGRRGTLEEIAAAACYLASAEADYVTGSTLVVDGGWTAR